MRVGEGCFRAARLALQECIVGHDVGGVAGGLSVLAAEDADIAGTLTIRLDHLPNQPSRCGPRRERGTQPVSPRCRFGSDAGVRGLALDLDLPVLLPHGADDQLGGELVRRR